MPVNHVKEYLIFIHTGVVFSHFFAIASNYSHYSNFGNYCPKLGTGTPEDMSFTNLDDATWFPGSGLALLFTECMLCDQEFWKCWAILDMNQ